MPERTSKPCGNCKQTKALTDFYRNARTGDGRTVWCKACQKVYAAAWNVSHVEQQRASRARYKALNPERYHESTTLRAHNMTKERYAALMEQQGGVCAICRQTCRLGFRLAVDHDHACCPGPKSCGHCIRGLLCRTCNQGLGQFGDTIEGVRNALRYLEAHRARREGAGS